MTDRKLTVLPTRKREPDPIDEENAREIVESLKLLIARVESGHVVGLYGILVTDDPDDELSEESIETIREGQCESEPLVIAGLRYLADETEEEWRDGYIIPEHNMKDD